MLQLSSIFDSSKTKNISSSNSSIAILPSLIFQRLFPSVIIFMIFAIIDIISFDINKLVTAQAILSSSSLPSSHPPLSLPLSSLPTESSITENLTTNSIIDDTLVNNQTSDLNSNAKIPEIIPHSNALTSNDSTTIDGLISSSNYSSTTNSNVDKNINVEKNKGYSPLTEETQEKNNEDNEEKFNEIILNINTSSSFVANCTDVEFFCGIQPTNLNHNNDNDYGSLELLFDPKWIWWTFRGNNVSSSTLPGGRVIIQDDSRLSVLNIECAQFGVHDGDYQCHLNHPQGSHNKKFNSSKLLFEISDPIDPSNRTFKQEIDTQAQLKCHVHGYPKPRIVWQRYDPNTLITTDVEPDGRIDIEDQSLPDSYESNSSFLNPLKSFQSILKFETLQRSDNGTYKCRAIGSLKSEKPKTHDFNVIVLEQPEIHIEKIEIENKTSAVVSFVVDYDGNLKIEKYILELRNYTEENSTWNLLNTPLSSITTKHNYSTIKVDDLVHGANYGFRLAASNELAGQSEWSLMNITVPADVPSPINNVHLFSKTNETLLFGWRRPLHDNGAPIIFFQQILKDQDGSIVWNQTINNNNNQSRNKHMSLFSSLHPGSRYFFTIRACSHIGCSDWSTIFEAATSDGYSDPPLNIRLECLFDVRTAQTNGTIRWDPPTNPRGSIIGYNITLHGHTNYPVLESFEQSYEVHGNQTFEHRIVLKPNTNYTVRLCAKNKSGCGQLSHLTSSSMCQTSPTVPSEFPPGIHLERMRPPTISNNAFNGGIPPRNPVKQRTFVHQHEGQQLKLFVPPISERNGPFRCIRIIVIRLPHPSIPFSSSNGSSNSTPVDNSASDSSRLNSDIFFNLDGLSSMSSNSIPLSTYRMVHQTTTKDSGGAYIAKEFTSENMPEQIIIGDGKVERCYDDALEYDLKSRVKHHQLPVNSNHNILSVIDDNRSPRRINYDLNDDNPRNETLSMIDAIIADDDHLVENRELSPDTYYSAAIEVTVMAVNSTLLVVQSQWVEPVRTEPIQVIIPQSSHSLSETTTGILYGTMLGLILISVLFLSVICFLKRKATQTTPVLLDDESIGLTSFIRRTIIGGRKRKNSLFYQLNFNSPASIRKWASKPIPLQSLVAVFQQRRSNSDFLFQAEFDSLPESFPDRTTLVCDAPENVSKNRYPDIKSYDQTRVKLAKIDDGTAINGQDTGSDYINADFVSGYKDEKRFICAQGPTQKTVPDFWRLIFEQECCIIVMLTGIEEQGRIKCAQYWNDNGKPMSIGFTCEEEEGQQPPLFEVTTSSRREYSDYVIRRFSLKNLKTQQCRDVLHFHFVAWKDFLAPDQPSWLLRFIKRVNEHYCPESGPILVHCSAGVGRTGTFIAIDTLISQIDDGAQEINIFECVSKLRHQRNFLVQSLRQYIFVYRAIMEYVEFGDTEIEAAHLRDHYKQLKEEKADSDYGLVSEFEKLNEVFEEPKSCIVGSLEANRAKNRYHFIIPYDMNRVILNPSQDSCYINASFIQGYDHTLSFIVAQDPLEHTVNEFWWMVVEHAVNTMIMLSELGDGQSKCHCYWPSTVDETFDCDFVKIKLIEEEMFQYYIKRVFDVTKKKTNKSHLVNQYQFLSWKFVVPESTISLITLTDVVLLANDNNNNPGSQSNYHINYLYNQNHNNNRLPLSPSLSTTSSSSSPILVHCSGGGDRSSVFVAFASLVKQLRLEERVDVFQTARYTKSQRHCMLQTIAQYDFLYRCIIDYMDFHHICNTDDTQL